MQYNERQKNDVSEDDYKVIDWANEISPHEYVVEEIETKDEEEIIHKSTVVKCYGGIIKYCVIFRNKK